MFCARSFFFRSLGFGSNVCIAAFILQVVVTLSFAVGTWAHDPEIPPNKRGFVSNQSGITLVVSTQFHLPMMVYTRAVRHSSCGSFTTIMVPSSILYMMSGVIASKYLCDPYQNGDTQGFEILDNVTASLYVKGKWDPTENSDYELYNTTYKPGQGYPMYLRLLEENKALSLPSSLALPSGLTVKLSDAKNALDALSPRTASTAEYLEYTKAAIVSQLSNLKRITTAVFTNLGDCKPIRQFYIQCLEAFCDGTLLCMNGIWFSVWLVCGMFTTQIAVGLKLSKYLMRMDDYMYEGIEVEESVESPPDDKSSGFSVSYAPRKETRARVPNVSRAQSADRYSRLGHLREAKNALRERWKKQKLNRRLRAKISQLNKDTEQHAKKLAAQQWDEHFIYAAPFLKLTKKELSKIGALIRTALKRVLNLPKSKNTERFLQLGLHNTATELFEAQRTAQLCILSLTKAGTRILSEAGLQPLFMPPEKQSISAEIRWAICVDPDPRNIYPVHNEGRRRARTEAIMRKIGRSSSAALFVDAAQYWKKDAYVVTVFNEKGCLVNASTAITRFTHEA
ncbi:hypothetical protein HPB51_010440 [Rhipicephalus microplus]|uniref:Uncharacterized protein n=1 Tax=Rhipicephalus microplus TaxID=6941 RepID=A0A9J6E8R1_RHIMP|nr:hypothetical protein HPB51_010440 [Rhipicephalus microplus]